MAKLLITTVGLFIALLLVAMSEAGKPVAEVRPQRGGPGGGGNKPKGDEILCENLIWIGNDTFQIFTENNLKEKWADANDYCQNVHQDSFGIDGRLAVLPISASMDTIRNHLKDSQFSDNNIKGYWIGCSEAMNGSDITWLDGGSVQISNSTWFEGQPDYSACNDSYEDSEDGNENVTSEMVTEAMATERCCQLWNNDRIPEDQFKIADVCCTDKMHFICQFPDSRDVLGPDTCSSSGGSKGRRCTADLTYDEKGIIRWPTTRSGNTAERKCPFSRGNANNAWRECLSAPLGAVWGPANTSECIPQDQVSRGNRLSHLANTIIPPGQAKKISRQLKNLTSEAESFEESDMALSIDIVGNIVDSGENGTEVEVAEDVLRSVDNLMKVGHGVLKASQKNENAASRLIKVIEKLSLTVALGNDTTNSGNKTVTIETPNIAMTVTEINPTSFAGLNYQVFTETSELSKEDQALSIHLPTSLLDGLDPTERDQVTRAQFVTHKSNTFFEAIDNSTSAGFSPVVAASIGEFIISNLEDPVTIRLPHHDQEDDKRQLNISCVFWDFSLNDGNGAWSGTGCGVSSDTRDGDSATVCECNHLTNFALLVDTSEESSANRNAASAIIVCGIYFLVMAMQTC